jgi:hypothetical protein
MNSALRTYIRPKIFLVAQRLVFQGHVDLGSLEQANKYGRKHQCTLKFASWGYYKNQSRGRPHLSTPLPSPADTVPPFAEDSKISTLEETSLSSYDDKSHHIASGGGSPIEQSSDKDIESPASDSTRETEEQDLCLDNTLGLKLPEQYTFTSLCDSAEGPPTLTSSRFSLPTMSESDKDEISCLWFALDSDQDLLHDTTSDETALFHDWNNVHLLETHSPVAAVIDQSSKATHQHYHFANASPFEVPPVSAGSKAVLEPSPPVLARSPSRKKRNVPPALLHTNTSIRPIGFLLPSDLSQIENLARLFSASGASKLAFRIHHIVLHHVLAALGKNQTTTQLFRVAINLTRNATTKAHFGIVSDLIKKTISKRCHALSPTALEACVLHSYVGNSFRQRKGIRAAQKHCRLALEGYQSVPQEMRKKGHEIVLATHLDMLLEAKITHAADVNLERLLATFSEAQCAFEPEVEPTLEKLADWCKAILTDSDFLAIVEESPEELWEMAPTAKDFEQLEATILFWCFCLKYWREEQDSNNSTSSKTGGVLLAHLEQQFGIEPHDSLFTMAGLLLGNQFAPRDSNERRSKQLLVNDTQNLAVQTFKTPTATLRDFIAAYSSTIRTKCRRFSTESFQTQVQDYLRTFAESHILLNLSEYAFQDPYLRPRPPPPPSSQLPTSLPLPPILLPMPRSSWSGFASMASRMKGKNKISTPNTGDSTLPPTAGLRLSTGSSNFRQRFNLGESTKSLCGSSAMDVDPVDILVQE